MQAKNDSTMNSQAQAPTAVVGLVCPECKGPLLDLHCAACGHQYVTAAGCPVLLPRDPALGISKELTEVYEEIYSAHSGVWVNQGRTAAFIEYFSGLINAYKPRRLLEIGCGEGVLLRELEANEKWATDLATSALAKAVTTARAKGCIALGERLPFANEVFDLVTSVGVMEHFIDDRQASAEICRVTRAGGHYLVLIHIHLTVLQSLRQKIAEYIFPVPRPIKLVRWALGKFYKRIHQPIQNAYTIAAVKQCLEQSGFTVQDVIHTGVRPRVPLIGPHVIIYVCEKPRRA